LGAPDAERPGRRGDRGRWSSVGKGIEKLIMAENKVILHRVDRWSEGGKKEEDVERKKPAANKKGPGIGFGGGETNRSESEAAGASRGGSHRSSSLKPGLDQENRVERG